MSDSPGSESDIQWLEGTLYHSVQPSHSRGWSGFREIVACTRIGNRAVPISHLTVSHSLKSGYSLLMIAKSILDINI